MNKTIIVAAMTATIFGCAQNPNARLEAEAEAIEERAEALQELEDAKIDLAMAQGVKLTPKQLDRQQQRVDQKAWVMNALRDYAVAGAGATRIHSSVSQTMIH